MDKVFIDIFNDFLDNKKDYLNSVLKEYENIIENLKADNDIEQLQGQISVIEKQKDKLLDLSLKGIIDDIEFKKRNDKFNLDIEEIQLRIDKMNNPDLEYKKMKEKIAEVKNALVKKINVQEQLPNLMRVLVERIEVEKIDNDRKHVRLIVYFNFKADIISKELEIDNRKGRASVLSNFYNSKCPSVPPEVQNGENENTNLKCGTLENSGDFAILCPTVTQKQSRFC